jgi:16S rRNA (cytosine1402-N4)-methyltransferase
MFYHVPALLDESIRGLNIRPDGIYVDVTFGGGGHSMEILKRLRKGRLIAFDQDEDASQNVPDDRRLIFLNQNFRFLKNNLKFNGISSIDGLIADLGVSFHQFDEPERGFTFRRMCRSICG